MPDNNKHTPEPWAVDPDSTDEISGIVDSGGNGSIIRGDYSDWWVTKANARRIVACVNACAGCATEVLETAPVGFFNSTYGHPKYLEEITKQRDELLSDLAAAKRSAEFNFEQYQDVGRLLHEECEKTEKLLAAMIHIQQVACSGSPELGIAIDAIASVKGKQ